MSYLARIAHATHLSASPRIASSSGVRATAPTSTSAVSQGTGDYGEGFAKPEAATRRSPLALVEALGRFVVHYPSHIWLVALVNRVDIFLHAYLIMNAAYAARAFLGIARSLGRKG